MCFLGALLGEVLPINPSLCLQGQRLHGGTGRLARIGPELWASLGLPVSNSFTVHLGHVQRHRLLSLVQVCRDGPLCVVTRACPEGKTPGNRRSSISSSHRTLVSHIVPGKASTPCPVSVLLEGGLGE